MSIVITGATGALGGHAARIVLKRSSEPVVVVARRPGAAAGFEVLGAEVRYGDFDEPASLAAAFAGGHRMLLVSTPGFDTTTRLRQHRAAIDAARRAAVDHIVYTSFQSPHPTNPAAVIPTHRLTEEYLKASGLAWTFLRNGPYADGLVAACGHAAATGRYVTNAGPGRAARVRTEDCGAAAAAVLLDGGHRQEAIDITGPEALADSDLAAIFAEATGKPVSYQPLDDESFVRHLVDSGLPELYASVVASFGRATREGHWEQVSPAVADLTGQPPGSIQTLLSDHRAELDSDTEWLPITRLSRNRPPSG